MRFGMAAISVFVAVFFLAVPALAYNPLDNVCKGDGAASSVCKAPSSDPVTGANGVLVKITNIVAWVGGVMAVLFLIFAAFKYVTSGGDAAGVNSAKGKIMYSIVGLIIIVVARTLIIFVINKL